MKSFVSLILLSFAAFSLASPILSEISNTGATHRWTLVPDAEGRMHLVDLNPIDIPVEPSFNAETDIVFLLYTRQNPTVAQRLLFGDLNSLRNSNFNPNHPTRFTIHGWQGSHNSTVNRNSNSQYFILGDFNMITVDWSAGAGTINYITARNRVSEAGAVVGSFIDFLHEHNYIRFQDLNIIGHSLGGQVVGLAGKSVTRGRIQVILALDPAGPLFSLNNPEGRVDASDGVYVEVIHTNGGTLGFREPIGQADFFPNFGRSQPGCGVDVSGQCAHELVNNFHAESILTVFTGHECTSFAEIDNNLCTRTGRTARMGGPFGSVGTTGNFHLTTNAQSPFSQG